MKESDIHNIVNTQIRIDNDVISYYKKICKRVGFRNLKGFNGNESDIIPEIEFGEVRLYESIDGEEFYSDYIKTEETVSDIWYGINGNYFIKNFGNNCYKVYLLSKSE